MYRCIHAYTHMHMKVCVIMYIHVHVCMYACIIYAYIHTCTCIYIITHTFSLLSSFSCTSVANDCCTLAFVAATHKWKALGLPQGRYVGLPLITPLLSFFFPLSPSYLFFLFSDPDHSLLCFLGLLSSTCNFGYNVAEYVLKIAGHCGIRLHSLFLICQRPNLADMPRQAHFPTTVTSQKIISPLSIFYCSGSKIQTMLSL